MPSYSSPPPSPMSGFFPTGTTSPNAFSGFHQNPRDSHNVYSAFIGTRSSSSSQNSHGSKKGLKKMLSFLS
ncbi:hypothetical protein D9619_002744 [Psilocybe cf. subviscida]|uniref:Uncharacterized protein n=1 Tax=Psilocybe cf. subviscida TaxID=2480587 RepID=A0A8H5AXW0_9AGAR|nr:hypothetical protein D9619_002744 [Psilocybe cf. subviscida]